MSLIRLAIAMPVITILGHLAVAQVISDTVSAPSAAGLALSRPAAKAGETVNFTISFDAPTSVAMVYQGSFNSRTDYFQINALRLEPGQSTAQGSVLIPTNADGGDYQLAGLYYNDGRRNITIPVVPITLHVIPLPKPVQVLPSKASVVLNLNQRQFIREQSFPLIAIRDRLLDKLNARSSYSPELRDELITALQDADSLLPVAKKGYIGLYEKAPILQPTFFDDFHRSYLAAITELRDNHFGAHASARVQQGRLVFVQLSQHKPPEGDAGNDWLNHPLNGTYPLLANASIQLLNENIRAYLLISDSGLDTFSIRLASIPSGATISYWRAGTPPAILGKTTDIPSAIFPYAAWTFKFEKAGCEPITRTPDPYIDGKPEIVVELSCKNR